MVVQGGERRRKSTRRKSEGKRWKERSAVRGSCAQSGITKDLSNCFRRKPISKFGLFFTLRVRRFGCGGAEEKVVNWRRAVRSID